MRSTNAEIKRQMKVIQRGVLAAFNRIPRQLIDADTGVVVNQNIYQYQTSAIQLQQLSAFINDLIRSAMLPTGLPDDWFIGEGVSQAYELGTGESVVNLGSLFGDQYGKTIDGVLLSGAYQDRVEFVVGRVFEEMEGFTADMRTDLARTLGNGMAAGDSPRVIARAVRKRVGVNQSRALKIARTEINQAHRRARWDESESSSQRLGLTTKLMHLSALIPGRTRRTHAIRHGRTYTRKEVEDWYQVDGNAIHCLCTQVEIQVDADGNVIDKGFARRVQEDGKVFFDTYGVA